MNRKILAFFLLMAIAVAAAGVLFVISMPEFNAQAAAVFQATSNPYPGGAMQSPTQPLISGATQAPAVPATGATPTLAPTLAPFPNSSNGGNPSNNSAVPVTGSNQQYVVQPGDSLSSIAAAYGVSLNAIVTANPQIANPNLIFPGQIVYIPNSGSIPGTGGTSIPNTGGNNGFFYVVQPGNTLSGIAAQYGVTVAAILAANPTVTNANLIFPGQVIFIPNGSNGSGIPPTGGGSTYVVQPGDTMFSIARRYGVTLAALQVANPQVTNINLIFPGQVLALPSSGGIPPTGGGNTYVVQPGDTMSGIAAMFGVSLQALEAANPQVTNPNFILPGQVITIPQASSSAATNNNNSSGTVPNTGGTGSTGVPTVAITPQAGATQAPSGTPTTANTPVVNPTPMVSSTPAVSTTQSIPNTGGRTYAVRAGDTLASIASANHTDVQTLLRLNPSITNQNLIFIGQVINLP